MVGDVGAAHGQRDALVVGFLAGAGRQRQEETGDALHRRLAAEEDEEVLHRGHFPRRHAEEAGGEVGAVAHGFAQFAPADDPQPARRQGVAVEAIGLAMAEADDVARIGEGDDLAAAVGEELRRAEHPAHHFEQRFGAVAFAEQHRIGADHATGLRIERAGHDGAVLGRGRGEGEEIHGRAPHCLLRNGIDHGR